MAKRQGTKKAQRITMREFEKNDLGDRIRSSGTAVVIRPQTMTSIRLDDALVKKLKERAAGLGIGYQTLLKMIVKKHVDSDL